MRLIGQSDKNAFKIHVSSYIYSVVASSHNLDLRNTIFGVFFSFIGATSLDEVKTLAARFQTFLKYTYGSFVLNVV